MSLHVCACVQLIIQYSYLKSTASHCKVFGTQPVFSLRYAKFTAIFRKRSPVIDSRKNYPLQLPAPFTRTRSTYPLPAPIRLSH